ncbi:TPA: DUF342 domain-containing protein [Candidatus Poribacteria bacterium]|nr:DUF342 domain-containing protein [Candidatus Poribacteria bacterium]
MLKNPDLSRTPKDRDFDGEAIITELHGNIYLTVTRPIGQGKNITMEAVEKELALRGIHNVNYEVIKQAIETRSGEPIKIGDLIRKTTVYDAAKETLKKFTQELEITVYQKKDKIKITISEDKMKAYLQVDALVGGDCEEKLSRIMEKLRKKKVIYGIYKEKIVEVIENKLYSRKILVAEGQPAIEGRDAELIYLFPKEYNATPRVEMQGDIDYYYLDGAQAVEKNQVLVRKKQAVVGRAGINVSGRTIKVKKGHDVPLPQGKNTIQSKDGTELLAAISGYLIISNDKINVERKRMVIKGDASLELIKNSSLCGVYAERMRGTQGQAFTGDVTITGDVFPGEKIFATGDIEILGSIHESEVSSEEGNIFIYRGGYNAKIKAMGNVEIGIAENCTIDAKGDVLIHQGLSSCIVTSENRIIVNGEEGIVGGSAYAGLEIQAVNIGSQEKISTEVGVFENVSLAKEIRLMLEEPKKVGEQLNIDTEPNILFELMKEYIAQKEKVDELKLQQEELELSAFSNSRKVQAIKVKDTIHEGVTIQVGNAKTEVNKPMHLKYMENYITIYNSNGRLARRKVTYAE